MVQIIWIITIIVMSAVAYLSTTLFSHKNETYTNTSSFELIDPKRLAVIQGLSSTFPNKPLEFEDDTSKPSVDGTPNGQKSMFLFAFNKASPECCVNGKGNGYSSSSGCICLSDNQKKYFSR